MGKLKITLQGVSHHVSVFADENIGYWHPKNIKFKHQHDTCYPPSTVYFNNIGNANWKITHMLIYAHNKRFFFKFFS